MILSAFSSRVIRRCSTPVYGTSLIPNIFLPCQAFSSSDESDKVEKKLSFLGNLFSKFNLPKFLLKDQIVAKEGFNRWYIWWNDKFGGRWLIPPASLSIHLSIGSVYAWSIFNTPLSQELGCDEMRWLKEIDIEMMIGRDEMVDRDDKMRWYGDIMWLWIWWK